MNCKEINQPEVFTDEQIAECEKCGWASGKKLWCGKFGIWIREPPKVDWPNDANAPSLRNDWILTKPGLAGVVVKRNTGCGGCGKKIIDSAKKLMNIGQGYTALLAEKLFAMPELSCPDTG